MESKKSVIENKLWCCFTVAHNCALFMYANCLITYYSVALILFIVFLSFLWEIYGWLWHAYPSLLKSARPTIDLIIFSNDFRECVRHAAVLQCGLYLNVLLVPHYSRVPSALLLVLKRYFGDLLRCTLGFFPHPKYFVWLLLYFSLRVTTSRKPRVDLLATRWCKQKSVLGTFPHSDSHLILHFGFSYFSYPPKPLSPLQI